MGRRDPVNTRKPGPWDRTLLAHHPPPCKLRARFLCLCLFLFYFSVIFYQVQRSFSSCFLSERVGVPRHANYLYCTVQYSLRGLPNNAQGEKIIATRHLIGRPMHIRSQARFPVSRALSSCRTKPKSRPFMIKKSKCRRSKTCHLSPPRNLVCSFKS